MNDEAGRMQRMRDFYSMIEHQTCRVRCRGVIAAGIFVAIVFVITLNLDTAVIAVVRQRTGSAKGGSDQEAA